MGLKTEGTAGRECDVEQKRRILQLEEMQRCRGERITRKDSVGWRTRDTNIARRGDAEE